MPKVAGKGRRDRHGARQSRPRGRWDRSLTREADSGFQRGFAARADIAPHHRRSPLLRVPEGRGRPLLRSLAVTSSCRGHGVGQQLARAALDLARQDRVAAVYLLTATPADFFASHFGFRPIGRAEVPVPIQQSVEFISACPQTAQAMVREMGATRRWPRSPACSSCAPTTRRAARWRRRFHGTRRGAGST
jgi:GNAT superfamily N-acetyltransferase